MELNYYYSENGLKLDDCDGRCAFCQHHFRCDNALNYTKNKPNSTQVTANETK